MKNLASILFLAACCFFAPAFTFPGEAPAKAIVDECPAAGDHTTTVIVYKDGKRVGSGYKVSLEFVGGLSVSGFTKNFYTNSDGIAYVEHASEGTVKVYVDGNWSDHQTKGKAPGKISVYL